MGDKSNIIEVNGKRYDARTGRLLGSSQGHASPVKKPAPGIVMDGFSHKLPARPIRTPAKINTAHGLHAKTERSRTLMRTSVSKPVIATPLNKTIHAKAATSTAPAINIQPHKSTPSVPISPSRALRAQHAAKSSLISKFGETSRLVTKSAVLPVKHAPGETPKAAQAPITPAEPNIFQQAMERSTGHEQQKTKKPRMHHKVAHKLNVAPRVVSFSAGALSVLLLAGFFAYQNIPNLALRVASARAGLNASMPGYHPSGYGVKGAVQYSPGQIVITYGSHSDDREFKLTQRKSEWNNETLLSQFVAADRRSYQTYQDNGRTIYMYEGSNATWIEKGVWYQIEGQNVLSSDQLIRMAASL